MSGTCRDSLLRTTAPVKGNPRRFKRRPNALCNYLLFLGCVSIAAVVLVLVLVLGRFNFPCATDYRTKLLERVKEIEPAVIEQHLGMKLLALHEYSEMEERSLRTSQALEETKNKLNLMREEQRKQQKESESFRIKFESMRIKSESLAKERHKEALQIADLQETNETLERQLQDASSQIANLSKKLQLIEEKHEQDKHDMRNANAEINAAKVELEGVLQKMQLRLNKNEADQDGGYKEEKEEFEVSESDEGGEYLGGGGMEKDGEELGVNDDDLMRERQWENRNIHD